MSRLLIYDGADRSLVGRSWRVGARVVRPMFDSVVSVTSVGQALDWISRGWGEVQIWGHGAPGAMAINGRDIPLFHPAFDAAGLVWFRSCSTLGGYRGHEVARELAARGIAVAGHTQQIGQYGCQSGLVAVGPGERPHWRAQDTRPDRPSAPWEPRTILAARMTLPAWAAEP